MFYRKKVLLAAFEIFGYEIEKLRLQKLLFLFCQLQKKPSYHFVPYKYGCFSFHVNADLMVLKNAGMVDENDTVWKMKQPGLEPVILSEEDEKLLRSIQNRFSSMKISELIRYTYLHYPFYAINSTILNQNLNPSEIEAVQKSIRRDSTPTLFTIGYEGKSLEECINILLKSNISLLCDVRKNAYSMKYGFSKSTLSKACSNAGITYLHFPDLGIESAQRKEIDTKEDYWSLFENYKKTVLVETVELQKSLFSHIEKTGRVALMCFEADPTMCHRTYLAKSLLSLNKSKLPLVCL